MHTGQDKRERCEWIKMWYMYTTEYYSAIKRKEGGSFVETSMELEFCYTECSTQKDKNKYRVLMHIYRI